jgi:hypothetical protein
MNKYIKTDIEQGIQYLKIGIMNAFSDLESGEVDEINLGNFIPFSLIRKCAEERGYQETDEFETNGWDCDCWYYVQREHGKRICIEGNLWYGTSNLYVADE